MQKNIPEKLYPKTLPEIEIDVESLRYAAIENPAPRYRI